MSQNDNQQRVDDQNRQAARVRGQLEQLQQSLDRQEQQRQTQQRQEQQRQTQQRQEQQRQTQQRQEQQRQTQQRQTQQRQEQQRQAQQRQEQQRRDSSSNAGNAARSDDPAKSSRDSQEALGRQRTTIDSVTTSTADKTKREEVNEHSRTNSEHAEISDDLYESQSDRWNSGSLEDAASYALRRDEEHQERQEALDQIIDETNDPIERERLTLLRDVEHHSYAADQIDRIMDTSERCDRMAGTNITASPEMQRLRERGAEHRSALSATTQALERHNAQHPLQGRSATEGRAKANTAQHQPDMSKPDRTDTATSNTPSPRPSFSERASARREAAEATGSALPKRDHSATVQNQASQSPAPARSNDESRTRSR